MTDHFEEVLDMIKVDQKGVAFQGETRTISLMLPIWSNSLPSPKLGRGYMIE